MHKKIFSIVRRAVQILLALAFFLSLILLVTATDKKAVAFLSLLFGLLFLLSIAGEYFSRRHEANLQRLGGQAMKDKVRGLIAEGNSKQHIFESMGREHPDPDGFAKLLASQPGPGLIYAHQGKNNILIGLMIFAAFSSAVPGYMVGIHTGLAMAVIAALLTASLPLVFAWAFYKYEPKAYALYVILSAGQVVLKMKSFSNAPVEASISIVVGIAMILFVGHLCSRLFPDLYWNGSARKDPNGNYVFTS